MKRRKRTRKGFTLLEVLLVLAILVILGSTVTYYFVGAQKKAYERQAKSQISIFENLLTSYHMDVGSYPSTQQGLTALRAEPAELSSLNKWGGPYANKDIPPDPWGNPYQYESAGEELQIWSWGADGQDGSDDDVSNMTTM